MPRLPPSENKQTPFLRLPFRPPGCWRSPGRIRYSAKSTGLSRLKPRQTDETSSSHTLLATPVSPHPSCLLQTFLINTQERVNLQDAVSTAERSGNTSTATVTSAAIVTIMADNTCTTTTTATITAGAAITIAISGTFTMRKNPVCFNSGIWLWYWRKSRSLV